MMRPKPDQITDAVESVPTGQDVPSRMVRTIFISSHLSSFGYSNGSDSGRNACGGGDLLPSDGRMEIVAVVI